MDSGKVPSFAQELTAELNGKYRFQAELTSQLGVLPSYTALGMASLLPHKKLEYGSKGDVLADGYSTVASERDSILHKVGGMACFADDLMKMKKEEGRELIKDKRVVYIYHNKIDAIGDSASTDSDTFQSVRDAINELATLITLVINNLNGHHVLNSVHNGNATFLAHRANK